MGRGRRQDAYFFGHLERLTGVKLSVERRLQRTVQAEVASRNESLWNDFPDRQNEVEADSRKDTGKEQPLAVGKDRELYGTKARSTVSTILGGGSGRPDHRVGWYLLLLKDGRVSEPRN